ncbi:MAG: Uma2 family endonuclease [Snowella sp.]|nr:Uma2 family endonuclease [Snowella sp.]
MVTIAPKIITLESFLTLPETEPASEYSQGTITQKPMPKAKHSRIQSYLVQTINQTVETPKIALAFTELRCTFVGRSLVPDITVMRWENLPRDETGEISDQFNRCPDWIIEILSPEQSTTLVMEKIIFSLQQGTELGWLIDPFAKSVTVFQTGLPKIYFVQADKPEILTVLSGLENLQLSVNDIFACLKV